MIEVWWASGSPFAWRVLLACEAKGVPYESRRIDFGRREHKTEAFLARNPRGKVPVLAHGDTVVYESVAILAYLEAAFPEPPLLGRTPAETALVWQRVQEADHYGWPALKAVTSPFFRGYTPDQEEAVRAAVPAARAELGRLEEAIGVGDVLVGRDLTAADLTWYPILASLLRALLVPEGRALDLGLLPFDEHFPAISRLMDRVEAMPGFDGVWPPHWGDRPVR